MVLKAMDLAQLKQNVGLRIIPGEIGDNATIEFMTPNGNNPNKYGNRVYLWESVDTVPWGKDYQQCQVLNDKTRRGYFVFKDLNLEKRELYNRIFSGQHNR